MVFKMFTVYDSKAEYYLQPFQMMTKGEAIRNFTEWANDTKTTIGKHPEDYILYEIGEYDNISGVIRPTTHATIGKAIEFVNRPQPQAVVESKESEAA